ncbi:TIM44 subunit of mitochondria import inner membrane translocase [Pseudovirgaria hyperparasitica]|uniref:Mitochondrial import inner membrane translocase subunit TIM44 n=1 Tax=Pseudovirgaria hyperparasitica TaxID=470096 RepID=A0A6A6WH55_9PEZI|nr:TIM44 subunit of mitochondria import inner membrane translocase [Pseudovirgaria hyperparasitica]KAF2761549.1 TIM44 subunit of mitochondria import inner membrane translocase [Pseudovirgaria hyperparasitica]
MRNFSMGLAPPHLASGASRAPSSFLRNAIIHRRYSVTAIPIRPTDRLRGLTTKTPSSSLRFLKPLALSCPLSIQSTLLPNFRLYSRSSRDAQGQTDLPKNSPSEGDRTAKADNTAKDTAIPKSPGGDFKAEGETGKEEARKEEEKSDDKEKKKEEPPPPPPHGDKTPWQVFTETLRSEFKASKEWNESTKALQSGMDDFTANPNVQKARTAYTQSKDAASTATSAAFSKTGKVLGHGAAWTWDTTVIKGVRQGVNAAGRGIEKATRPVRETEAFKSVKNTLDDGSSSRYGGWTEKEERRKRRELRELNELQRTGGRRLEKMEEDAEAGTNVTLHKDAKWNAKWSEFKDSSRVMQGFFSMKSAYNESENPFVATARGISDRIAGFFAENETAQVIKKFREMDPNFKMEPFLTEMREYILPEVLDAYVKGDIETLKLWLSAAQYQVYAALMQQYTTAGLKSDGRILDIRNVDVLSSRMVDPGDVPVFIVTCRTQEVHVYKNAKSGDLAAGQDDRVQQVTYVIGMTRLPDEVSNPETRGWRMIELHKSARDYL